MYIVYTYVHSVLFTTVHGMLYGFHSVTVHKYSILYREKEWRRDWKGIKRMFECRSEIRKGQGELMFQGTVTLLNKSKGPSPYYQVLLIIH